jgi:hypothetical protein
MDLSKEKLCLYRFVCIIVAPTGSETRVLDMGKAFGTLMSDQVSDTKIIFVSNFNDFTKILNILQIFPMVPYKATSRKQIVKAINSYTQEVTVLAPSVWDPEARLEPPDNLPSVVKRYKKIYPLSQWGETL